MFERDSFRGVRGEGGGKSFSRLGDDGDRNGVSVFPIGNMPLSSTIVIVVGLRTDRFCGGLEVDEPDRRERLESPMSISSSMVFHGEVVLCMQRSFLNIAAWRLDACWLLVVGQGM